MGLSVGDHWIFVNGQSLSLNAYVRPYSGLAKVSLFPPWVGLKTQNATVGQADRGTPKVPRAKAFPWVKKPPVETFPRNFGEISGQGSVWASFRGKNLEKGLWFKGLAAVYPQGGRLDRACRRFLGGKSSGGQTTAPFGKNPGPFWGKGSQAFCKGAPPSLSLLPSLRWPTH